ncbi:1-(5-phosphoribosyl)-5-[(5-phosphoribosylamino)methylideneamino]imidazole-4-carboxamide isomerase [Ornithinibacillus scapharcae]|uniref:1-(5-phosphoribosyl)-5-[(5- phosphoribosylamino)methylideneamino]imidazole-4- carboxamide isomerase n=1 Tax=Ornithinibacillus scapharcae TaxID=1147159 RepID=UPI000225BF40|nr:1-(5-phosphoribosyl)-5-[(5-phosphoribosylamino)methylideneamino]imidazole-4-carboxamide isomerase [Ornithinibacillus scapharcae]
MIIFPAIDILDGKCVRLIQGDYNQQKLYNESPLNAAEQWMKYGAETLHIVDLNGAKSGTATNKKIIGQIAQSSNLPIQVGGGIRSLEQIEEYFSIGVQRVILGTTAIHDFPLLQQAVEKFGDRIIVSIDARNGMVATEGWIKESTITATDLVENLEKIGIQTIVYTDIARDGMLQGPNFEELATINQATSIQVIASGGITTIGDVVKLQQMNLYGTIIGKALYDGRIELIELLEVMNHAS